ncbi:MAG TPA: hypothetical protein VFS70_11010 [Actinomycetota bacterium]|nr:hypothetical protein [Actinomycetota bacterium]
MTERYGSSFGDDGGQRPSGRGAVTERLARRDQDAREIDLTDEAAQREAGDDTEAGPAAQPEHDQADRESSGAFEPALATPTADPPAEAERPGSSSIFDVDERARQEDLNRTGYEPPVADPDAAPDGPRGETIVTEPGEAREEPDATRPADDEATAITPTPVPAAEPPADTPAPEGLPEPEPEATAGAPAATDAPATAGTSASLVGSLDADGIRNRFLDIQAGFVDEPRQAVEEAGRFVDELLQQVADALREQRAQLAGATDEGSTEDLRLALRAYRQFVDRILGMAT